MNRSEQTKHDSRNSVIFSLKNQVGGLARALQVFQVSINNFNSTIFHNYLIILFIFKLEKSQSNHKQNNNVKKFFFKIEINQNYVDNFRNRLLT